ncbi:MAG TPA: flagellar basal body-associated FliL family protein [Syntrophorhabdaceae bacterium]|nr:flagellar basal body-associated FliL family protein [Syntrophorhabdaceae bacterium]
MEENEVQEIEEKQAPKKKGKFKFILLMFIVVLCLGIAGVYFLYGNLIMERFFDKPPQETQNVKEKKTEKHLGPIAPLEPFLFNIAGTSGKYAKITIGVQFKDHKSMEVAKSLTPVIRDKVLTILSSKNIDYLMDVGSRDSLKQEMLNAIKVLLPKEDAITAVYITDIMIQ